MKTNIEIIEEVLDKFTYKGKASKNKLIWSE